MSRVLVPPFAGVLSALGLALAAERREAMASVMRRLDTLPASELDTVLRSLSVRAGAAPGRDTQWWLRARYTGQGHELDVALRTGEDGTTLSRRFADLHASRFGFTLDRPVEVVSARCAVSGAPAPLRLSRGTGRAASWDGPHSHDSGGPLDVVVRGPATVTLPDATLLVKPGWIARSLEIGGWLLEREVE
jgi:N-methylhydantoinase A